RRGSTLPAHPRRRANKLLQQARERPWPPETSASYFHALERALHDLDVEALDHVALFDVLELAEAHAALLAHDHFVHFFLEPLQGRERAHFLDYDVVAQDAHFGALAHDAFRHLHASDLADLGNVEHLQHFSIAEEGFARVRREHAGHR